MDQLAQQYPSSFDGSLIRGHVTSFEPEFYTESEKQAIQRGLTIPPVRDLHRIKIPFAEGVSGEAMFVSTPEGYFFAGVLVGGGKASEITLTQYGMKVATIFLGDQAYISGPENIKKLLDF